MDEVYPNVFVGNANHAMQAAKQRAVDCIVTLCTFEIQAAKYDESDVFVPFADDDSAELSQMETAVCVVRDHLRASETVLVHCNAGVSRSPTVVATALALENGWRFTESLSHVQSFRSQANPNPALRSKVEQLYPQLFD